MFDSTHRHALAALAALGAVWLAAAPATAMASDFSEPWKRKDRALVVDAYEYNAIDWGKLAADQRIVGFINKASDGLSPPYACPGTAIEEKLCKTLWRRHAVARELFHTRRPVAKALGMKWGAYHLARPGNPIDQANNFIDFAEPQSDDLLAIDIEDNDPEQWMSLADAEAFVRHIHRRLGRFPLLYTNGTTARHIADRSAEYPLLSRLPLWYARYMPEIGMHFPKGNWDSYALWQFSSQTNCNIRRCPYRVAGADDDIDVNVAPMDAAALRAAWPFGGLVDPKIDLIATVPVPVNRDAALAGPVTQIYARVQREVTLPMLLTAFQEAGNRHVLAGQHPAPSLLAAYHAASERYPGRNPVTVETRTAIDLGFTTSIGKAATRANALIRDWIAAGAGTLPPRSTSVRVEPASQDLVGGVPTTP